MGVEPEPSRESAARASDGTASDAGDPAETAARGGASAHPDSARARHERALADFARRRDALAAGAGVPEALAHSPAAARQWVSDELTQEARELAERAREANASWLAQRARYTVFAAWGGAALLFLGQLGTAFAAGWTLARTAGLVAAVLLAGLVHLAAWRHGARGGVLAPLIGADNRLSTSRAVAAAWLLLAAYAVLFGAVLLAGTGGDPDRAELLDGLELTHAGGLLTVLTLSCAVTVWVRHTVATRVRGFRMQKVPAARPRGADLLTDDAGKGSFTDVQYVLVNGAALAFAAVRLARSPRELPDLPWAVALLVAVSALTYVAAKYTEGGRPVIQSVVRVREPGAPHAPIRHGDELQVRGSGFVPAGAEAPERLAETVVRIGGVHVPVPLVPVDGGFRNPHDTLLTVPVPAEVDAGNRIEIQVITAAGTESGRYLITVAD